MDKIRNSKLCECIERVEKWFWYDTISLLDCVLTDDPINPEYSANTVYSRLEEVVNFQELYYSTKFSDVTDLLLKTGYPKEDIELLNQKRCEEWANQTNGQSGDGSVIDKKSKVNQGTVL